LAGAAPVETHISLVFLGPDTVWKLKKAVRLSFLDFSSLAQRRRFCLRELELNGPAAPGLYRDVVPVVRGADGGLTLGEERDADRALDWVLRMARVPEGDFLDVIAERGGLSPALLDAMADSVAAYHHALPPAEASRASEGIRATIAGNARAALAAGLEPEAVVAWEREIAARLEPIAGWLDARGRAGFVRRAHGDLHLGNLCLWHGRPVPFDALEFDEALATIDLGYDLAFLLMDIEHRVGRPAANRVLNRYVARTGDAALVRGLPVFLSLRAMVRAHVEATRARPDPAHGYLREALGYLLPAAPLIVGIGGLQGTGKSTLARALAPELGAAPGALVVRSDEVRKRQHGVAPEAGLPAGAYSDAASGAVFAELFAEARTAAEAGHAVVADATFLDPAHRAALRDAAEAAGVAFLGLWLWAPLEVLEARVAARTGDASDATVAVLRAAAASAAASGPGDWLAVPAVDAGATLAISREAVTNLARAC
jgi:aminoglycoside phosphotransferase family enzyme/predicted kinase